MLISKITIVFDRMQLIENAVDLIDHHLYDAQLHSRHWRQFHTR